MIMFLVLPGWSWLGLLSESTAAHLETTWRRLGPEKVTGHRWIRNTFGKTKAPCPYHDEHPLESMRAWEQGFLQGFHRCLRFHEPKQPRRGKSPLVEQKVGVQSWWGVCAKPKTKAVRSIGPTRVLPSPAGIYFNNCKFGMHGPFPPQGRGCHGLSNCGECKPKGRFGRVYLWFCCFGSS